MLSSTIQVSRVLIERAYAVDREVSVLRALGFGYITWRAITHRRARRQFLAPTNLFRLV